MKAVVFYESADDLAEKAPCTPARTGPAGASSPTAASSS